MPNKCPGSEVEIVEKVCPKCGEEVELFTGDFKVKCSNCGTVIYRDKASCIEYCPYAEQCFGAEAVKKVKDEKQKSG